jgi:hypothetical protein
METQLPTPGAEPAELIMEEEEVLIPRTILTDIVTARAIKVPLLHRFATSIPAIPPTLKAKAD